MSLTWVVTGHLLLAPLLVLSQPPWSGWLMLMVRVVAVVLFLLVLVRMVVLWRRLHRAGASGFHYFLDWFIPLLLAGLGLLLLCSQDRGSMDHLFQRVDLMLMNEGRPGQAPAFHPGGWYDTPVKADAGLTGAGAPGVESVADKRSE